MSNNVRNEKKREKYTTHLLHASIHTGHNGQPRIPTSNVLFFNTQKITKNGFVTEYVMI